jgi:hypothetical protein
MRAYEGQPFGRRERQVREPDGGSGDRDRDGVAPRGRRLPGAARHGRPEDDGSRGGSLQEGVRRGTRTSFPSSSSRVSSRKIGRRSTRSNTTWPTFSTSGRSGRNAGRRSTRSCRRTRRARKRPRRRTRRSSATRTSIWLSTRTDRNGREAETCPASARTSSRTRTTNTVRRR